MQVNFVQIPSQIKNFHCDQSITGCLTLWKEGMFHLIHIPYISKSVCYHPRHQEINADVYLVSVSSKLF
ncbi:hypothetical protein YC2023_033471 [Brassica napus]